LRIGVSLNGISFINIIICPLFRFETDEFPGNARSDNPNAKDELDWSINYRISDTCTDMIEE
jgi:hypothetical protein